jgi:TatD DNase family protein
MNQQEILTPPTAGLVDTHAHYCDRRFDAEYEGGAHALLEAEVFGRGVAGVINAATNPENALVCMEQAARYRGMYVALGIHPEDCKALSDDPEEELSRLLPYMETAEARARHKVVAVGEIGLDYYWQPVEPEKQMRYFRAQLELARRLDLPVIIHDREAHGDCFETLLQYEGLRGVLHSFSGSPEMARELARRGFYISFSGVLTFKNARKTVEAAAELPLERILIETDAPYLAPEPFRGKLNHSGRCAYTAARLGAIRSMSPEEILRATRENAERLFGVKFHL